jgi:hypothetical protein
MLSLAACPSYKFMKFVMILSIFSQEKYYLAPRYENTGELWERDEKTVIDNLFSPFSKRKFWIYNAMHAGYN